MEGDNNHVLGWDQLQIFKFW